MLRGTLKLYLELKLVSRSYVLLIWFLARPRLLSQTPIGLLLGSGAVVQKVMIIIHMGSSENQLSGRRVCGRLCSHGCWGSPPGEDDRSRGSQSMAFGSSFVQELWFNIGGFGEGLSSAMTLSSFSITGLSVQGQGRWAPRTPEHSNRANESSEGLLVKDGWGRATHTRCAGMIHGCSGAREH